MILPFSYTGGPRYKVQNYQDAMGICVAGYLDLFITFQCNTKWAETTIKEIGDNSSDARPDCVCRAFHAKLGELMIDIKKKKFFGRVIASKFASLF